MVDNDDPIMVRQIINAAGYDTETGIYGVGYSPDNGKTFYVQNTSAGRKFRQQDADGLWPLLIDKVKSVMSIDWDSIQNKPKFVTPDELEARLDKLSVPTVKWSDIEDKPPIPSIDGLAKQSDLDNVKATADSATSKAEQAQSTADANTKALQNVYTKEESDQKYWTVEQEQNASNVKSVNNIEPDDQGNVNIDLTGYVKQDELPKSMSWSHITDKPNLALTSDIPSLDGYAKLKDIPSVSGLVKETELADYAKKSDLPTMPDLSGYATVSSLIDYAKKSDLPDFSKYALKNELPITMAWQNITGKPDLATQDDLKNIELKSGPQGPQGLPGKDGQNGITPHIDTATGNWFVGSIDTGIKAQGPQGSPGKDGQTPDVSKLTTKTAWSETGITYINGAKAVSSSSKLKCRAITIGDVHIVQVNGWFTAGNLGNHNFLPQVQVPAFGFENDDYYFEAKGSVTSYDSFIQVDSKAKCQINLYSYSTQNGPSIPLNAMWIY